MKGAAGPIGWLASETGAVTSGTGAAGVEPTPAKFRGVSGSSARKRLNCSASRCCASCDTDCVEKGICSDMSSCGGLVKT